MNSITIFSRFQNLVEQSPGAPALLTRDQTWSRKDLLTLSERVAEILISNGLERGDLVAIQMRNSPELLATIVAAFREELVVLPIDRDMKEAEVARVSAELGAAAVLTEGKPEEIRIERPARTTPPSLPELTRLVKLTSGSTGQPRGVATSEANLIADALSICDTMDIGPEDRNLGAIPLSHSYGFSNLVTPLLLQGTSIVLSNDYLPLSIIELANARECTVLPGVPMIFDHLSTLPPEDGDFTSLRKAISAGAPLRAATAVRFRERFGLSIHTFYGCSECGGISYDRDGGAAERGTVGRAMSGVELQITTKGTLTVRSSAVALGYVNAGESEQSKLEGDSFHAEDCVEITPDGELRITGRVTDLINVGGRKVNPREVEEVILRIPGVRDVKVTGAPGGARGQIVAAVVEATGVDRNEIRRFCAERLASYKLPRHVTVVDALPRTSRGKIQLLELADT